MSGLVIVVCLVAYWLFPYVAQTCAVTLFHVLAIQRGDSDGEEDFARWEENKEARSVYVGALASKMLLRGYPSWFVGVVNFVDEHVLRVAMWIWPLWLPTMLTIHYRTIFRFYQRGTVFSVDGTRVGFKRIRLVTFVEKTREEWEVHEDQPLSYLRALAISDAGCDDAPPEGWTLSTTKGNVLDPSKSGRQQGLRHGDHVLFTPPSVS